MNSVKGSHVIINQTTKRTGTAMRVTSYMWEEITKERDAKTPPIPLGEVCPHWVKVVVTNRQPNNIPNWAFVLKPVEPLRHQKYRQEKKSVLP